MLNDQEFYGDGFGRDVISADSPQNRRNRRKLTPQGRGNSPTATIAWVKFLSTPSRVRTGSSGLPCALSGRSEKRPSIIHDSAFSAYFFFQICSSLRTDSPFQTRVTHRKVDSSLDM